jgi:hypothetical protein
MKKKDVGKQVPGLKPIMRNAQNPKLPLKITTLFD